MTIMKLNHSVSRCVIILLHCEPLIIKFNAALIYKNEGVGDMGQPDRRMDGIYDKSSFVAGGQIGNIYIFLNNSD